MRPPPLPFPLMAILLAALLARAYGAPQETPEGPKARPSPEAVKGARESIRDLFKNDYARRSSGDRETLARRLLLLSQEPSEKPAVRAALLLEARDLAGQAGDLDTVFAAMKEIPRTGCEDPLDAQLEALEAAWKTSRSREAAETVASACLALAEEGLSRMEYALAERALLTADSAARGTKNADLAGRIRETRDTVRAEKREYSRAEPSLKKIEEEPENPEANLAAGKFMCFVRREWEKGLPMLAHGSDSRLREIAAKDAATPKDPRDQAEVGDLWWEWSERQFSKDEKQAGQERAANWYEEAAQGLPFIEKARIERRLQAFYDSGPARAGGAVVRGNVALGKNGTTVTGAIRGAELVDGVTTGYTGSLGYAYGHWPCEIIVTLPRAYLLRQIRMLLWDGEPRFYRYALETSPDGQTYVPLVDRSQGEWRSWQTIPFPPRRVKTIKVKGVYNSANNGFHVVELEAYCVPPPIPAIPK